MKSTTILYAFAALALAAPSLAFPDAATEPAPTTPTTPAATAPTVDWRQIRQADINKGGEQESAGALQEKNDALQAQVKALQGQIADLNQQNTALRKQVAQLENAQSATSQPAASNNSKWVVTGTNKRGKQTTTTVTAKDAATATQMLQQRGYSNVTAQAAPN